MMSTADVILYHQLAEVLLRTTGQRTQQEIASWCGVSQVAVSSWYSGRKRPRLMALARLAELLRTDPYSLAQAALYTEAEIAKLSRFFDDRPVSLDDFDLARANLRRVHQATRGGSCDLAVEMSGDLLDFLKKVEKRCLSKKHKRILYSIRAQTLYEQSLAYRDSAPVGEIWGLVEPISAKLAEIGSELQNGEIQAWSALCKGDAYYILRRSSRAAEMLQPYGEDLTILPKSEDRLDLVRTLALSLAYTKSIDEFQKVTLKIRRTIESSQDSEADHPNEVNGNVISEDQTNAAMGSGDSSSMTLDDFICQTLEGLGRGQGILGLHEAFDTLAEARAVYGRIVSGHRKAPFRLLQIIRSELEVIPYLETDDKSWFIERAKEGLGPARDYGYTRLVDQIEYLLEIVENSAKLPPTKLVLRPRQGVSGL